MTYIFKIQDSRLFVVIHLSPGIYIQSTLWHHENYFDYAIIVRKNTLWHHDTRFSVANTLSQQHWTGERSTDRVWPLPWPAFQTHQEDSDIECKKGLTWYCQRFSKRYNMGCFSNSDSRVPRLINLKNDCAILRVQGLVEAIKSPWFLWRMFKKSNLALVAPDESRILMSYNFSLEEQTSVISLYYIQHPEGSATSNLTNHWVTICTW